MLTAVLVARCGGDSGLTDPPGSAPVVAVTIAPDVATLIVGDTMRLAATPRDSAGTVLADRAIVWTSSDTSVATVSGTGLVTARADGTVTITAAAEGQRGQASITVNPLPVASVAVTPDSVALTPGDTVRLVATPLAATGDTLADRPVTWSSSDTTIATVNAAGLVTARAEGSAAITATSEDQHANVVITVGRASVAQVLIAPDDGSVIVDSTLQLTATVLDSHGDTLTDRVITWSSSDTTIATVDANGLVTGHAPDTVTITATAESGQGTATIRTVIRFAQVTAGVEHACGVTWSGTAYCWGRNWAGQLGNGTTQNSEVPVPVSGDLTFEAIAAGNDFTCGLVAGSPHDLTYCWGFNTSGQVGNGVPSVSPSVPTHIQNDPGFAQLAVGADHVCGLVAGVGGGAAYCWGAYTNGELGSNTTDPTKPALVDGGLTFTELSAGYHDTCGITASGKAYCWGLNDHGQLGDSTTTDRHAPTAVAGVLVFDQLSARGQHTCGVTSSGAYCWGTNQYGEIGNGTTIESHTPTQVGGGLTFTQLATSDWATNYHTCGVVQDGSGFCWGHNTFYQLGDGTPLGKRTPTAVSGGLTFKQISTASNYTCAVTTGGLAYCWGEDLDGTLGNGVFRTQPTPTPVAMQQ